jgi:hypothetical protein
MDRNFKIEKLLNGESIVTSERGNSMYPLIKSGQKHELAPIDWSDCKVGDIVYCKVKGSLYTHLVKSVDANRGVLIGNNRGNINGWTKQVWGKVIRLF